MGSAIAIVSSFVPCVDRGALLRLSDSDESGHPKRRRSRIVGMTSRQTVYIWTPRQDIPIDMTCAAKANHPTLCDRANGQRADEGRSAMHNEGGSRSREGMLIAMTLASCVISRHLSFFGLSPIVFRRR